MATKTVPANVRAIKPVRQNKVVKPKLVRQIKVPVESQQKKESFAFCDQGILNFNVFSVGFQFSTQNNSVLNIGKVQGHFGNNIMHLSLLPACSVTKIHMISKFYSTIQILTSNYLSIPILNCRLTTIFKCETLHKYIGADIQCDDDLNRSLSKLDLSNLLPDIRKLLVDNIMYAIKGFNQYGAGDKKVNLKENNENV